MTRNARLVSGREGVRVGSKITMSQVDMRPEGRGKEDLPEVRQSGTNPPPSLLNYNNELNFEINKISHGCFEVVLCFHRLAGVPPGS